jgi:hypothetical protein
VNLIHLELDKLPAGIAEKINGAKSKPDMLSITFTTPKMCNYKMPLNFNPFAVIDGIIKHYDERKLLRVVEEKKFQRRLKF